MEIAGATSLLSAAHPVGSNSTPGTHHGHSKDAFRVVAIVLGAVLVLALVGCVVYMAHTRYTVRWRAAHPETHLTVVERQRKPKLTGVTRIPDRAVPSGVTRTMVSTNPAIDQFDAAQDVHVTPEALVGLAHSFAAPTYTETAADLGDHLQGGTLHNPSEWKTVLAPTGETVATVVTFEHGPLQGGGIHFPFFGLTVQATPGRSLVVFPQTMDGHKDPRSSFALLPGTRVALTNFFNVEIPHGLLNGP
jgi:hypothetical protein